MKARTQSTARFAAVREVSNSQELKFQGSSFTAAYMQTNIHWPVVDASLPGTPKTIDQSSTAPNSNSIGANTVGNSYRNLRQSTSIDIAEILIYDRQLTTAEENAVFYYIKKKYNQQNLATFGGIASKIGEYELTFEVADAAGNVGVGIRTIVVADLTPPEITLIGDGEVVIEGGSTYVDAGAIASMTLTVTSPTRLLL